MNQSKLPAKRIAELEAEIPVQENLQELMRWALSDPSGFAPQVVANVVVQDEFTHDVVLPWRGGLVLVYDTMGLGGITAVAVWDHMPSAKELLECRMKEGWSPRPSLLKEGDRVVGHAACVVTEGFCGARFYPPRIEQALAADSPVSDLYS